MKHLVEVVIPLAEELDVPPEPPVNVPKIPEMKVLGIVSELGEDAKKLSDDKLLELRKNGNDLRDQREDNGDGDQWYEKNELLPPDISELKDFRIEMLFAYNDDDGTQCLGWCQGTVQTVINEKTLRVRILWDEDCLGVSDVRTFINW